MPRAKLNISAPESVWIHAVSRAHPSATFRVVGVLSGPDRGVALLEIAAEAPESIREGAERHPDVVDFEFLDRSEETATAQVETTNPALLTPLHRANVPIQTPFEVRDGMVSWEFTTTASGLSALGNRLDDAGIEFDLEYVRDDVAAANDHLLTDRQRELVVRAAEMGYYDTPRRATLTDLSASLGITKATGSDILHRAEGKIVKRFLDETLSTADERPTNQTP